MRGGRWVAAVIVMAIAISGISAGAAISAPSGKDPGSKKAQKHKKKKKKAAKKQPKPVAAPSGQTVRVDAFGAGAFHVEFTASRATGAPADQATGRFKGSLSPIGPEIGHFAGPVTCLEVEGNDIGLFYPLDESSPPGLEAAMAGVFISVTTDGKGNALKVGFVPVPAHTASKCPPSMAPPIMPATGSATIAAE